MGTAATMDITGLIETMVITVIIHHVDIMVEQDTAIMVAEDLAAMGLLIEAVFIGMAD